MRDGATLTGLFIKECMMKTPFPPLSHTLLNAANCLGGWLAHDESAALAQCDDAGLVVLAGNAVLPTIEAACQQAALRQIPLLISGGIGHSTPFLYRAVAAHPHYHTLPTAGRPEAAILADMATTFWHIPPENVLVEDKSANCGENARFTLEMMKARQLTPARGILVQDPTMQRRTAATFARVWRGEAHQVEWINLPGIVPVLTVSGEETRFAEGEGLWSVDRYLALIAGEIPRLRNDEQGYGPRGRDFIEAVVIPEPVNAAWHTLQNDPALEGVLTR